MNFIKKNIFFLCIFGGFTLLLGGSLFLLHRQTQECQTVEEDLRQKSEQRRNLWNRKIFPSNENVTLVRKNAEEAAALVGETSKVLRGEPLQFEEIPGSQCKENIFKVRREMLELLVDKNQIKLPDKFQFGFDRYEVQPPRNADTPMLQKQLHIVQELIQLVAEARFQEISLIRRVEFEPPPTTTTGGRSSSAESASRPPTSSPSTEPLLSMYGKFEYVNLPDYIYSVMPFELEVHGDTNALRNFLEALARAPHVFLPRIINIENEKKAAVTGKEEIKMRGKQEPRSMTRGRGVPSLPSGGAPDKANFEDPSELPYVLGEEKIKVGMRIEWLEFCPPPAPPAKRNK